MVRVPLATPTTKAAQTGHAMRLVTYWLQSPVDRLGRAGSCAFKVPLLLVLCAGLSRLSLSCWPLCFALLRFRSFAVRASTHSPEDMRAFGDIYKDRLERSKASSPKFGAAIARRSCVGPIVGDWCRPLGACSALTCLLLYGVAGCCCDVFIIHIWILKSIGNRK